MAHPSPRAIVSCVSAAAIHELTDEMPAALQFAVPTRSHPPAIDYPRLSVFRFDESAFEVGLSGFDAAPGERVRIYDPARTVVDLTRFRRRLGEPIASAALHRYLSSPGGRPELLLEYAGTLSTFGLMRAALDMASAQ